MTAPRICKIDGCERATKRGQLMCCTHAKRKLEYGPDPSNWPKIRTYQRGAGAGTNGRRLLCRIGGCTSLHCQAGGLCRRHHRNLVERGDPSVDPQLCRVPGCTRGVYPVVPACWQHATGPERELIEEFRDDPTRLGDWGPSRIAQELRDMKARSDALAAQGLLQIAPRTCAEAMSEAAPDLRGILP